MPKPQITPVKDSAEKQMTYRNRIGNYNKAVKYGFYCEAIMIVYAMIEDRLRSMLYHMGFLSNRQALSVWKKTRPFLLSCVKQYKDKGEDEVLGVKTLSGKIKIVRCVYKWAANVNGGYESDRFVLILKNQIEGTDIDEVLSVLDEIDKWRNCRNEIVHSMMNKNIEMLEETIEPQALAGMNYARSLDAQERKLKAGNRIRKTLNLPMN